MIKYRKSITIISIIKIVIIIRIVISSIISINTKRINFFISRNKICLTPFIKIRYFCINIIIHSYFLNAEVFKIFIITNIFKSCIIVFTLAYFIFFNIIFLIIYFIIKSSNRCFSKSLTYR